MDKNELLKESPIPCQYKVGDYVTYTNSYGVVFPGKKILGFSPYGEILPDAFIHLENDAWWYPQRLDELQPGIVSGAKRQINLRKSP